MIKMKLTADPQFGGAIVNLRIGEQDIVLSAAELQQLFALLAIGLVGNVWPGLSPADAAAVSKKIDEELCRERRA